MASRFHLIARQVQFSISLIHRVIYAFTLPWNLQKVWIVGQARPYGKCDVSLPRISSIAATGFPGGCPPDIQEVLISRLSDWFEKEKIRHVLDPSAHSHCENSLRRCYGYQISTLRSSLKSTAKAALFLDPSRSLRRDSILFSTRFLSYVPCNFFWYRRVHKYSLLQSKN